jgi:ABC-type uncharacterized transport system permease subunit
MTTDSVMTQETTDQARRRRVGALLATGAPLFAAGVAGEWVLHPQRADGEVTAPLAFAVCVGLSLVGAVLLLRGVSGMAAIAPGGGAARWGRRTTLVGTALLAVAVATVLVTGLVSGSPHPASFVPYGLGVLALAVGPVVLGTALRRARPRLAALLVAAGLAAFASVAIPLDPWHDVSLMAMLTAWTTAGVLLRRG